MIRYRPFRNTDPPALAELWCRQPPQRALLQPLSAARLETHVFSKPYFDRHGLIVAEDEGHVLGFVHAGFSGAASGATLSTASGATCMLLVAPRGPRREIAAELLHRGEDYLRQRGARTLWAGCVFPANAFYVGLYGYSPSPGIVASDAERLTLYQRAGYAPAGDYVVLQCALAGFRPLVNRQQMQLRRRYQIEAESDPPPRSWWEACTIGPLERTRHRLVAADGGAPCGTVSCWNLDRRTSTWGVSAMGLDELAIAESSRRQGLGTFLVGEALRFLQGRGSALATVQVDSTNAATLALFHRLGFQEIDRGYRLCKSLPAAA